MINFKKAFQAITYNQKTYDFGEEKEGKREIRRENNKLPFSQGCLLGSGLRLEGNTAQLLSEKPETGQGLIIQSSELAEGEVWISSPIKIFRQKA